MMNPNALAPKRRGRFLIPTIDSKFCNIINLDESDFIAVGCAANIISDYYIHVHHRRRWCRKRVSESPFVKSKCIDQNP